MDSGDLIWVNFDPAFGPKQSGRRPALVLSNADYNARSSFAIVCPITSAERPWPFHVPLPPTTGKITGSVVVDQIKAIERRRVVSPPVGRVNRDLLKRIEDVLALITFGHAAVPDRL
jgi:mRNA interferase MazF